MHEEAKCRHRSYVAESHAYEEHVELVADFRNSTRWTAASLKIVIFCVGYMYDVPMYILKQIVVQEIVIAKYNVLHKELCE